MLSSKLVNFHEVQLNNVYVSHLIFSGTCGKGDRCKFSHDLEIERKAEKRSLYDDTREGEENSGDWDDEKLKEVVEKKHAEADKRNQNKTDIVGVVHLKPNLQHLLTLLILDLQVLLGCC